MPGASHSTFGRGANSPWRGWHWKYLQGAQKHRHFHPMVANSYIFTSTPTIQASNGKLNNDMVHMSKFKECQHATCYWLGKEVEIDKCNTLQMTKMFPVCLTQCNHQQTSSGTSGFKFLRYKHVKNYVWLIWPEYFRCWHGNWFPRLPIHTVPHVQYYMPASYGWKEKGGFFIY